jgi:hypothetical protein
LLFLGGALLLMVLGVLLMPLRGRWLARAFSDRLLALSERYQETVREAAGEQIEHGVRLRQDVAAPFTRLVGAQLDLQHELAGDLRKLDADLATLAGQVGALWK